MGSTTAPSRSPTATRAGSLNSKQRLLAALVLATTLPATATASFLSSPLNAIRAPRSYSATAPTLSTSANSSSSGVTVNDTSSSTVPRYGHSAIYHPTASKILFIGGQVGSEGTQLTPSVLEFNLHSSFLWGDRPTSSIPDNPSPIDSTTLPAHAWASAALDAQDRTWLLGGVTQDCSTNPVAYVLGSDGTWSSPTLSPRAPPRRRQSAVVSLVNSTTSGIDLFVFGGIADGVTCSEGVIGYRGIDRYNTATGEVEIFGWTAPAGAGSGWEPPVSDATAVVLEDEGSVAVVGGQTASGVLVEMTSVLVFDVDSRSWTAQPATGDIPSPRMGHILLSLGSDQLLLHGGLSSTHSPLSDLHLLSPSADLTESWTWSTLSISTHSLNAPARAWHTATLTEEGVIVVAFGMDTEVGEPSDQLFFLSFDETDGTYTWTQEWEVESSSPEEEDHTVSASAPVVHAVVVNPKATIDSSGNMVYASEAETMSYQAPASTASTTPRQPSSSSTRRSSSRSSSAPSASSTLTSQSLAAASEAATKKQRTIAASVSSLVALVAVVGLAALFIRRRNSRKRKEHPEPDTPATFTAPFVSTLLYTRPSKSRMLSLGSTVSARRSVAESEGLDHLPSSLGHGGGAMMGQAQDPFSDAHQVDEIGQLRPTPQHPRQQQQDGASPSLASVASIPYLAALTRTVTRSSASSSRSSDTYTAKPPTLAARRSLRSNTPTPSIAKAEPEDEKDAYGEATPPAQQQEFGVALTSDSPRPGWLDFVKPSSTSAGGELFMGSGAGEMVQVPSRSSTPRSVRAVVGGAATSRATSRASEQSRRSTVPSVLRPHTPLRVINADPETEDPFRDQ